MLREYHGDGSGDYGIPTGIDSIMTGTGNPVGMVGESIRYFRESIFICVFVMYAFNFSFVS